MTSIYAQGRDGELYLDLDQTIKAIEKAGRADEPGAAVVLGFLRNCLAVAQEWAPTRDAPHAESASLEFYDRVLAHERCCAVFTNPGNPCTCGSRKRPT